MKALIMGQVLVYSFQKQSSGHMEAQSLVTIIPMAVLPSRYGSLHDPSKSSKRRNYSRQIRLHIPTLDVVMALTGSLFIAAKDGVY